MFVTIHTHRLPNFWKLQSYYKTVGTNDKYNLIFDFYLFCRFHKYIQKERHKKEAENFESWRSQKINKWIIPQILKSDIIKVLFLTFTFQRVRIKVSLYSTHHTRNLNFCLRNINSNCQWAPVNSLSKKKNLLNHF